MPPSESIKTFFQKMLIQQLRQMEKDGVVRRIVHHQVLPGRIWAHRLGTSALPGAGCALVARRLTQAEAAAALSINQPKVSALKHYKLEGLSVERLIGLPYRVSSRQDNRVALVAGFRRIDQATQAGTHCSSVARIRALRLRASPISRPTVPLAATKQESVFG
jgi:hypothetical protein